jgi:hypothetical protein
MPHFVGLAWASCVCNPHDSAALGVMQRIGPSMDVFDALAVEEWLSFSSSHYARNESDRRSLNRSFGSLDLSWEGGSDVMASLLRWG